MTDTTVSDLQGVGRIPSSKPAALAWLRKFNVNHRRDGQTLLFAISSLPHKERSAYELRKIEASGLPAGDYDDAAHERFVEATPAMQAIALRKAEIARFLIKGGATSQRLPGALCDAARVKFGADGTDKMTLRRILRAVDGVDPINFAPALAPQYTRQGPAAAPLSEAAWSYFLTTIRDAGPHFPLKQAWRDVRDVARKFDWQWPPYQTIWRRWNELPEGQKMAARLGREETANRLTMPIKRAKTSIKPLEWVSLDGRTQDFWVDFGDGKPVRPVMLALVDTASNYVLGYEIARSENAITTARLIRNVCQHHGIFDRLYTDNGSAFAGHLVSGGAKFKWRGKSKGQQGVKPLGVCFHLGIDLTFAIPKNARAKIAERTFATLSRVIDDRPEFKGAHSGHAPGAAPDRHVVPVPLAVMKEVVRREIDRHNREAGRKGQGAAGRSYEQLFQAGLANRIIRKPTAMQLYYASLIYTPASVDSWGRVQIDNWTYGGPETQQRLLARHGKGQILIGRDPEDFEAPAVAFDDRGHLICKEIMPVKAGAYDSVDGSRDAAKNRKAARAAVAQAEAANSYLDDTAFKAALSALDAPAPEFPAKPAKVVGGKFGGLQPKRQAVPSDAPPRKSYLTTEMLENLDHAIGLRPVLGSEK